MEVGRCGAGAAMQRRNNVAVCGMSGLTPSDPPGWRRLRHKSRSTLCAHTHTHMRTHTHRNLFYCVMGGRCEKTHVTDGGKRKRECWWENEMGKWD
eukprot:359081-Chlamydomonas_euryale.AAC.1